MHILVTGGAGYIGSVITEELVAGGHHVVVFDNLAKRHRDAVVEGAAFIQGDVLDGEALRRALREHGVEVVVHMAADSLVGEGYTVKEVIDVARRITGLPGLRRRAASVGDPRPSESG